MAKFCAVCRPNQSLALSEVVEKKYSADVELSMPLLKTRRQWQHLTEPNWEFISVQSCLFAIINRALQMIQRSYKHCVHLSHKRLIWQLLILATVVYMYLEKSFAFMKVSELLKSMSLMDHRLSRSLLSDVIASARCSSVRQTSVQCSQIVNS